MIVKLVWTFNYIEWLFCILCKSIYCGFRIFLSSIIKPTLNANITPDTTFLKAGMPKGNCFFYVVLVQHLLEYRDHWKRVAVANQSREVEHLDNLWIPWPSKLWIVLPHQMTVLGSNEEYSIWGNQYLLSRIFYVLLAVFPNSVTIYHVNLKI